MDKPTTRLDSKKIRKTLREIGSPRRSNLPEKVKNSNTVYDIYLLSHPHNTMITP
jgi:hypothetical protein